MKMLKYSIGLLVVLSCASCQHYSSVTKIKKGKVLILRNDGLLFGLLRKAYVCDATAEGVSNCQEAENP